MCARYSAAKDLAEFARFFNFVCRVAFFAPRYNIAPRQQAPDLHFYQERHRRMPI
jgi:putative SOS response-associated peptidase YedK